MAQITSSNPKMILEYLDNLNVEEKVDEYFKQNDNDNSGNVDADSYKNIFKEFNTKIGMDENRMGKKEWDWVLNLINKKSGDKLNKKEAIQIFYKMILISRDYLHSLPNTNISNNSNNNSSSLNEIKKTEKQYLKIIKEFNFEGDIIKGKSINNIIDINNNYFLATIGERGKILINKNNFEVISYKIDFGMYITAKVNSYLISAINLENNISLWYIDFNLEKLEQIEYDVSDMHKSWITKIVQISENKIVTASGDNTIKIWELINEKKIKLIKTLNKHTSTVISIIKIENKNWLVSVGYDNKLIIWDLMKYSVVKEIKDVKCLFINGIKELPKQRLILAGQNNLLLIN